MCIHIFKESYATWDDNAPPKGNKLTKIQFPVFEKGSPRQPQNNIPFWCCSWVPPRIW